MNSSDSKPRSDPRAIRAADIATAAVLIVIGLLAIRSLGFGIPAALADAQSLRARAETDTWRNGQISALSTQKWARVRTELANALDKAPSHPQLYDQTGFIYAYRALTLPARAELNEIRTSLLDTAAKNYAQAAHLRPMFPYDWAHYALARHHGLLLQPERADRADVEAQMWAAFDKAARYGRNEPGVQSTLAEIGFSRWNTLMPERAGLLRKIVASNPPRLQKELRAIAAANAIQLDTVATENSGQ